jgi:anionic cell wall polymer biosynthesis LytR-Cps2A-Psr (LCP) family protein
MRRVQPNGRKRDASLLFLALIVVLTGAGIFAIVVFVGYDPIKEALATDQVINTLFILEGEAKPNETVKPLSSFVLLYYPTTKRAAIFDVPGEVGFILRGVNRVDRIDAVYDSARIDVFGDEIEALLGIEINYTLVFNLDTLGKTVDLIEGVELFIPSPVERYESDPPVLFASGLHKLDGDKAVSYLTYDDENRESVRLRRQRFFYAFVKRLGEQNEMLKLKPVMRIYQSFLKVNMNESERVKLFDEYAKINMDRVSIQSVAGTEREISGKTLLLPSYNGGLIKDIVRQALVGLTRRTEGSFDRVYTVEVLNGTATNGLAGKTAELLRGFGYDVISVGNAEPNYAETQIVDRSGSPDVARNFSSVIQCTNVKSEAPDTGTDEPVEINMQSLSYKADFILIIGRDFNGRYVIGG